AYDASGAMLVPERLLPRANGMLQTTWSLSGIVSPGLAAAVMALPALAAAHGFPLGWAAGKTDAIAFVITVDVATFAVSALVLALIAFRSPRRADVGRGGRIEPSIWADVRAGALYITRRPPLLWLLVTFTVTNLAGAPFAVVTPLLVKFNLAPDWQARGLSFEAALALLTSAGGLGGVAGGLLVSWWGGLNRRRVYGVLVPMFAAGLIEAAYGLSPHILVTAVAAFAGAGMHPLLNAHSQAIWQTQTPKEMQGRVFA